MKAESKLINTDFSKRPTTVLQMYLRNHDRAHKGHGAGAGLYKDRLRATQPLLRNFQSILHFSGI